MKTNDYKQSQVFTVMKDGVIRENDDLMSAIDDFFKHNNKTCLYVEFVLKRRQSVDTWKNQISKAIFSRINNINNARAKAGLDAFTDESLGDSILFTEEREGDNVKLVIWERAL